MAKYYFGTGYGNILDHVEPFDEEEDELLKSTSEIRIPVNLNLMPANVDFALAEQHMLAMLQAMGVDMENNPHMLRTPRRVAMMYKELLYGDAWEFTTFPIDEYEVGGRGDPGIVIQRDIPVKSLCAHHMAPFIGVAHVAYIPQRRMAGLSKLARTVNTFAKGLQTQEQIGINCADFLEDTLKPHGVAVFIECEHLCMSLRGVKTHQARTITVALRGVFMHDPRARSEITSLLTMSNGRV